MNAINIMTSVCFNPAYSPTVNNELTANHFTSPGGMKGIVELDCSGKTDPDLT